jgi:L-iditol 2-dehydrogenase
MHLSANEIDVSLQYRYANQYQGYPPHLSRIRQTPHRFALENAIDAFHVAADPAQGAIKVQIQD